VGGGGVARPPSERNFYFLKVFNITNQKLKIVFPQPQRKERYGKN